MTAKRWILSFLLLSLAGCGRQAGLRGSLIDHNASTVLEYRLENPVAPDAQNRAFVVEAGTSYKGFVLVAQMDPKIRSVRVAVPARGVEAFAPEFEIDLANSSEDAKASFKAALQNSGLVVIERSPWLHQKVRGVSAAVSDAYKVVSFKSLPLTLYNAQGEAIPRPEPALIRGKL